MYRIIEKINGKSTFYVQKKYGLFWSKIVAPYGYALLSTAFFVALTIMFFIFGIKFNSNNFPVGLISLPIAFLIIAICSATMSDFRIFIKFDDLYDSRNYIINKEKIKIERKTIVHYMNDREERADKLKKINRKKLFK
jgi:hypothetical protein